MKHLLEHPDASDKALLEEARGIVAAGASVSAEFIRTLNQSRGTDFATAVLYAHFESRLEEATTPASVAQGDDCSQRPLLVAIAPGAFYKEHPEIGGDGRDLIALSASATWDCELIPAESLGSIDANGQIIADFLEQAMKEYRVVLCSLSKGTADARMARQLRPDLFEQLTGWVSVSGVPFGTQMADWLLDKWFLKPALRLMLWLRSAERESVASFRYNNDKLGQPFREIPGQLLHIVGFPLQRHLSNRRARLWHRRFRRLEPNDSVVMLTDFLDVPGTVLPVWGCDHYLKSSADASARIARVIQLFQSGDRCESAPAREHAVSARGVV